MANAVKRYPQAQFTIYEQGKQVLQKVRISGGGRCNVTNAISDPKELVKNYPRGQKELLGPFYQFNTSHTTQWFAERGVKLHTEADGRKFPITNSSQTIIDCLVGECKKQNVEVATSSKIVAINPIANGKEGFELQFANQAPVKVNQLFIGAGSSQPIWTQLQAMGHSIVPTVPSLFTFMVNDQRINDLPGVSVPNAEVQLVGSKLKTNGPLLITHKGLSGPAILKLSAFGARELHASNYKAKITINFLPELSIQQIKRLRDEEGKQLVNNYKLFDLPKRLFASLIKHANIDEQLKWASTSNKDIEQVYKAICQAEFDIIGQNRFKEEFVTAGGVDLKEVDFTTFSSKVVENLYFAGEILNIDAVTGGFNFQSAWTGAYIASQSI